MPRLTNELGVVVSVSDEIAAALGTEWKSAEKAEKPAATKRTTKTDK